MDSIKLTKLQEKELKARLQAKVMGGDSQECQSLCCCACKGDNGDGKVNHRNGTANMREGKTSPGGGTGYPLDPQH